MLTRIRIKNFQCHKRFDLEFKERVTFIKGKSDSGKSAIVRALRWVLLNSISGNGFIRQGSTEAMVSCEFADENFAVTRRRTASKNLYRLTLDDEGRQHKDFVSFGNTVPAPIARELNLAPENVQSQFDAPFWLSLSDTQAAVQLNSIVKLESVDRSIGRLIDGKRKAQGAVDSIQSQIAEKSQRLESVKRIPAERFEATQEAIKALNTKRRDRLADLIESIEGARETQRLAPRIARLQGLLKSAEETQLKIKKTADQSNRLSNILAEIGTCERNRTALNESLLKAQNVLSSIKVCPECQRPLK